MTQVNVRNPDSLPLEGVRIADLTAVWAGPYATKLLADMGAEVIKIEGTAHPDVIRTLTFGAPQEERSFNKSAYFNHYNRNKLSLTLDLANPNGNELFKELVATCDVVIENYRVSVMDNLGLGYETLKQIKPDIIMVSMPGQGKTGPEKDHVAYGTNVEQLAGLVSISGYTDGTIQKSGISYGDPVGGIAAAGAVGLALHYRLRTGKGQYIDLAQRENLACLIGEAIMDWTMNQRTWSPMGNRHPHMAPHGCYRCKGEDTWVTIAVETDDEWFALCDLMGNPSWAKDEKFGNALGRWNAQDELDARIEAWTSSRTPHEVMHTLQKAGVAAGAVMTTAEILDDPHLNERGYFETVTHPEAGTWRIEGPTWKLSETPAHIRMPAPCFGEHNDYVLHELLGLSEIETRKLEAERVISTAPL